MMVLKQRWPYMRDTMQCNVKLLCIHWNVVLNM